MLNRLATPAAVVLFMLPLAGGAESRPQGQPEGMPATGTSGMVSSAHPLATDAGVEILAAGGNAFDAAVTVAAVLNVVEPMMSGIGGYGTTVLYDAKMKKARFLNSSGRIPRALDSDVFRPPTPRYEENRFGAKAISTPGNLNAWEAMWRQYGTLEWRDLLDPAVRLAERGFAVSERTASLIESAFNSFPGHAKLIYGKEGLPLKVGDRLIQSDLGRSLRIVAEEGAKALHGGELGRAIDRTVQAAGGFLSLKDLEENQAEWWEPIGVDYRGHRVVTASPPANAFPSLVRLGMMSRLDTRSLGHNSADYLHWFAEVTKHGFWTRLRYAGDPEVAPPPLDRLLSEDYWREQVNRIDPKKALPFEPPTVFPEPEARTTHFVVADRWGNVVSATQTLGGGFGSRIMPEGTGIWLNNSLAYCTFEPKGNPMDAFAGRHKLSGDCPTLVFREGRPWVAIGTPGGHTIDQTVPQMILNLIDFGMDIQGAIAAPRVSFVEPDEIAVEEAVPAEIRNNLAARGHRIRVVRGLGSAHGLAIEYGADGRPVRFTGGADPRGEGAARGLAGKLQER